eukprot:TRINITY_DN29294_c0_g2_i1.p1 TRINITY_DN29294_c0_g2~~TRINITY_DN29294_c0_g2_i1.p1  ORF type:complete len:121 (+),score=17.85 TRINITY_DN29294_c0_g2_i1:53-364(+)
MNVSAPPVEFMENSESSVSNVLCKQIATWQSAMLDVEELLDACVRTDETLSDIVSRCKVPKDAFSVRTRTEKPNLRAPTLQESAILQGLTRKKPKTRPKSVDK